MKDIEREARELIARKIGAGEIVQLEWAVNELMQAQGEMIADNPDFWIASGRDRCKRAVKCAIHLYEQDVISEQEDKQLVLDGYEHLRVAYSVRGELVPIEKMSVEDLLDRAADFDKQAASIKEHAKEIRKYVGKRKAA